MNHSQEEKTTAIAIIAIVAALSVLGVVIVLAIVTLPLQEAEAGCEKGALSSGRTFGFNQSRDNSGGKCVGAGR